MRLRSVILSGALLLAALGSARADAIPLFTGPQDPSQINANFNRLINQINAILTPLLPSVDDSVNSISLTPAVTGGVATIGLQDGADDDASIGILPNGDGDIVLFGNTGTEDGMLKFANSPAFVAAEGLAACPASSGYTAFGVGATVSGYLVVKDWLDVKRYLVAC